MASPAVSTTSIPDELFPASILSDVAAPVPPGYVLRPLRATDVGPGLVHLLEQLTVVGNVTAEQLREQYAVMAATKPCAYYIVVVERIEDGSLAGAATLLVEWKFIHQASSRGRIEDVVVDSASRGLGLGRALNETLVELARKVGVYKLSLECKDELIPFYGHFGYQKDTRGNFLIQRFFD